ncbi:hypothetical protein QBC36DRAFT_356649 [Triangularia setosa]|uniref:Uncharacterized protein n=1 Tax=Triangularia setosa TaxID=2587417 RepID=A0AAN7A440_9PEZI|nr:hypothetical protein QBC36DRAFT_356649 [Podospora setosa]
MSTETVLGIGQTNHVRLLELLTINHIDFIERRQQSIGIELATRFLKKGYKVFGTYRPQTKEDGSVAEHERTGARTIELDYADEASMNTAANHLDGEKLDILINCGATYNTWDEKPFTKQSADDLVSHSKINVVGPFLASKAFLPHPDHGH